MLSESSLTVARSTVVLISVAIGAALLVLWTQHLVLEQLQLRRCWRLRETQSGAWRETRCGRGSWPWSSQRWPRTEPWAQWSMQVQAKWLSWLPQGLEKWLSWLPQGLETQRAVGWRCGEVGRRHAG